MFILILLIVSLAFPVSLSSAGMTPRRVALVCLGVSVGLFGVSTAFGHIDIGPHVECPGWFLGVILAGTLMFSCGLALACRHLFRR